MVLFCNRNNTHGCAKVLYPSRRVSFNAKYILVDIEFGETLGNDDVDVIDYLNYVFFRG